jgi:tetratricopeptide (TPR) repeat protein
LTQPSSSVPDSGARGDPVGAARARRAFRLCVTGVVLITGLLWLSDRYLRYEPLERLYMMSLTLETPSARAVLRQAVRRDEEQNENPTPKYLQALAEREEKDKILDIYERAYKLDPRNAALAVRYGCRLFADGQADMARELFAAASRNDPNNALPMYLEAAVLPWIDDVVDPLSEAFALIEGTNSSRKEATAPPPLWFSGLPRQGKWYAGLRRQAAQECCAPLYRFADYVVQAARQDISQGNTQYWDTSLESLRAMGERLAAGALATGSDDERRLRGGSLQALAGVQIQLAATRELERLYEKEQGSSDETLVAQRLRLDHAFQVLQEFETAREGKIRADAARFGFPLTLCARLLVVLVGVFAFVVVLSGVYSRDSESWQAPHTTLGKVLTAILPLGLLLVLATSSVFQRLHGHVFGWMPVVNALGWLWLALVLLSSVVYPFQLLSHTRDGGSNGKGVDAPEQVVHASRKARRKAYVCFLRRYYGIIVGLSFCVLSLWVLGYRSFTGLYPWDLELLATGLSEEEVLAILEAGCFR